MSNPTPHPPHPLSTLTGVDTPTTVTISTRITPTQRHHLTHLATEAGLTLAAYLNQLITTHLRAKE